MRGGEQPLEAADDFLMHLLLLLLMMMILGSCFVCVRCVYTCERKMGWPRTRQPPLTHACIRSHTRSINAWCPAPSAVGAGAAVTDEAEDRMLRSRLWERGTEPTEVKRSRRRSRWMRRREGWRAVVCGVVVW